LGNRRFSSSEILNVSEGMAERMITVQSTSDRAKQEEDVDADLEAFNDWAQNKGGALARSERAILKTYLAWKLGVADGA
jgi:hypothetical protein